MNVDESASPESQGLTETLLHLVADPRVRLVGLTLYYLAILLGLVLLYGRGDFSTPPFVYQGF
jgi:D-Ala-teichoic acid biosynthesis protein